MVVNSTVTKSGSEPSLGRMSAGWFQGEPGFSREHQINSVPLGKNLNEPGTGRSEVEAGWLMAGETVVGDPGGVVAGVETGERCSREDEKEDASVDDIFDGMNLLRSRICNWS